MGKDNKFVYICNIIRIKHTSVATHINPKSVNICVTDAIFKLPHTHSHYTYNRRSIFIRYAVRLENRTTLSTQYLVV